tara:strand:- start:465 stop:644 length:180 start_codon:yes stop_codon:yes gene_type:complete
MEGRAERMRGEKEGEEKGNGRMKGRGRDFVGKEPKSILLLLLLPGPTNNIERAKQRQLS